MAKRTINREIVWCPWMQTFLETHLTEYTIKEFAEIFGVSQTTVFRHKAYILKKVNEEKKFDKKAEAEESKVQFERPKGVYSNFSYHH